MILNTRHLNVLLEIRNIDLIKMNLLNWENDEITLKLEMIIIINSNLASTTTTTNTSSTTVTTG
jgi:hypothetical protein